MVSSGASSGGEDEFASTLPSGAYVDRASGTIFHGAAGTPLPRLAEFVARRKTRAGPTPTHLASLLRGVGGPPNLSAVWSPLQRELLDLVSGLCAGQSDREAIGWEQNWSGPLKERAAMSRRKTTRVRLGKREPTFYDPDLSQMERAVTGTLSEVFFWADSRRRDGANDRILTNDNLKSIASSLASTLPNGDQVASGTFLLRSGDLWIGLSSSFLIWKVAGGYRGYSTDRGFSSDVPGEVPPDTDESDVLWLSETVDLMEYAACNQTGWKGYDCLPAYLRTVLWQIGHPRTTGARGGPYNVRELPCAPRLADSALTTGQLLIFGFHSDPAEAMRLECTGGVLHVTGEVVGPMIVPPIAFVPDMTIGCVKYAPAARLYSISEDEGSATVYSNGVDEWASARGVSKKVSRTLRDIAARHELSERKPISTSQLLSEFWSSVIQLKTKTMKYVRISSDRTWRNGKRNYLISSGGSIYLCRNKKIVSRTMSLGVGGDPVSLQVAQNASARELANCEVLSQLSSLVSESHIIAGLGFNIQPEGFGATATSESINECFDILATSLTMLSGLAIYQGRYSCINTRLGDNGGKQLVTADLPTPLAIAETIMPVRTYGGTSASPLLDGSEDYVGMLPSTSPVVVGGKNHSERVTELLSAGFTLERELKVCSPT